MVEYKWIELHKIEVVNIKKPDFTDQEFVQGVSREELVKERMVHAEDKDMLLSVGYSDVINADLDQDGAESKEQIPVGTISNDEEEAVYNNNGQEEESAFGRREER
jgi:hypothetical protein